VTSFYLIEWRFRIYQRRYLALMVAGTWITAFSIMIPTYRGVWGEFGLDRTIGSCSILHDKNNRSPKEFLFIIAFMVPCICIVICYARIFYFVRKAAIRMREPLMKSTSHIETNHSHVKLETISNQTPSKSNEALVPNNDQVANKPFGVDEDLCWIDDDMSSICTPTLSERKHEVVSI